IGKERIRRAGRKLTETDGQMQLGEDDKKPLDIGFRVYKLDSSNLKTWDDTPIEDNQLNILYKRMNGMIHRVKHDRSEMDMVCEIMLKLGAPLTCPVSKIEISSKSAYTVGEDCTLLICLAENIQPSDVEAIAEYAAAIVVIARDSFADDTAMANAYYILRDKGIELKLV
ncbi:MAG TPA: site-specific DNA-methyltransferase, partial [Ruminococcaceae bacterium]|nr:site-specific DNA-methyltransferase [Oscillospiraceae bacterium]